MSSVLSAPTLSVTTTYLNHQVLAVVAKKIRARLHEVEKRFLREVHPLDMDYQLGGLAFIERLIVETWMPEEEEKPEYPYDDYTIVALSVLEDCLLPTEGYVSLLDKAVVEILRVKVWNFGHLWQKRHAEKEDFEKEWLAMFEDDSKQMVPSEEEDSLLSQEEHDVDFAKLMRRFEQLKELARNSSKRGQPKKMETAPKSENKVAEPTGNADAQDDGLDENTRQLLKRWEDVRRRVEEYTLSRQ